MIPSLILVRSNKKIFVTLTQKKSIRIGSREESDVFINHPHFRKHNHVLGLESFNMPQLIENKIKVPHALPVYKLIIDGIDVRLVHLNALFYIFLVAGIVTLSLTIPGIDGHRQTTNQDWTPITLPAKGIFGYCHQDREHAEGIRFTFESSMAQPYRLFFFAGGKGDGTSITFSLNGTPINRPLLLPTGWGKETSIQLPVDRIINGTNTIEVHPAINSVDPSNWGISDVRVVPARQHLTDAQNIYFDEYDLIIEALGNKDISGQELAHYYKIVSLWGTSNAKNGFSLDRDEFLKKIERRMEDKLYQIAFDVRSREILDEHLDIRQLLDDTARWIPETWDKGWKIYDELCH